MNLMNKVFMDELDKFVVVFIDDIHIYSKSILARAALEGSFGKAESA